MEISEYALLIDTLLHKRAVLRRRIQTLLVTEPDDCVAPAEHDAPTLHHNRSPEELAKAAIDEIGKINMALARDAAGQLGLCAACGQPIRSTTLLSVPWTMHCKNCLTKQV